jgi:S1-C subfamily serine protease
MSAVGVITCWIFGILAASAVVVYDTPAQLRASAADTGESCTALVMTDKEHGSGFSVDKGYLVTNNHVIAGASKITVYGHSEMTATVVGTDPARYSRPKNTQPHSNMYMGRFRKG